MPNENNWDEFSKDIKKIKSKFYDEPIKKNKINVKSLPTNDDLAFAFYNKIRDNSISNHIENGARISKSKLNKVNHSTVDATLDLHGLTLNNAETEFFNFVIRQYYNEARTVLVITGKGKFDTKTSTFDGIIKNSLPRLISNMSSFIKSSMKAPVSLGGDGAFIIGLRRKK